MIQRGDSLFEVLIGSDKTEWVDLQIASTMNLMVPQLFREQV
jgi:hypothetical protein